MEEVMEFGFENCVGTLTHNIKLPCFRWKKDKKTETVWKSQWIDYQGLLNFD